MRGGLVRQSKETGVIIEIHTLAPLLIVAALALP